jgi:hypothetical protein
VILILYGSGNRRKSALSVCLGIEIVEGKLNWILIEQLSCLFFVLDGVYLF